MLLTITIAIFAETSRKPADLVVTSTTRGPKWKIMSSTSTSSTIHACTTDTSYNNTPQVLSRSKTINKCHDQSCGSYTQQAVQQIEEQQPI